MKMITKVVNLLLKILGRKPAEIELLDIDPELRQKMQKKFGVKNPSEFGDFSQAEFDKQQKIKRILRNKGMFEE